MQTLDGVQQPQGLSAQAYAAARLDQRIRARNNKGFRHALVCALLWGLSYCGLDMLLSRQGPRSQVLYLDPVVIACLIAFLVVLVQAVLSSLWSIRRSSTLEWLRYVIRLDRDNAYLLLCALVSGSVAWLSYLVMQHT
ncbi:MAG: hypothetical protein FWH50_03325, partial [Coriobacteriia bacterium]|nr:hypothetical protein [Coriobacteriia bacterium]